MLMSGVVFFFGMSVVCVLFGCLCIQIAIEEKDVWSGRVGVVSLILSSLCAYYGVECLAWI